MAAVFKAGQTALITGGASGIGLALAKRCVGHGMKVLVADLDDGLLGAASNNAGGAVGTFRMDVSKPDDWAKLKSKVKKSRTKSRLSFGAAEEEVCRLYVIFEALAYGFRKEMERSFRSKSQN